MANKHLMALGLALTILITSVVIGRKFDRDGDKALPILSTLAPFELRNQDDRLVNLDSLKGRIQVIDFIFTSCPGVCPLLTERMAQVEKNTRDLGDKVHFVSISVDHDTDTPAVLRAYAEKRRLPLDRWDLLTGPLDSVARVVVDGFHSSMGKERIPSNEPGTPDLMQITHGEKFVVVDAEGRLRAFYDAKTDEDVEAIVRTVQTLVRTRLALGR